MKLTITSITLLLISFFTMSFVKVEEESSGKDLYKKHCKKCHGKKGKGIFGYPPLTDAVWTDNDEVIVTNILKGLSGEIEVNGKSYNKVMPPVKGLKDDEVAEIVNFIRTNFISSDNFISVEKVGEIRLNIL